MIGEQTSTGAFENVALGSRQTGNADVECVILSVFETLNDFIDRVGEAESARQIIGRAKRKNTQWNSSVDELRRDFCDCSVASGGDDNVGLFLERFFPAFFLYGIGSSAIASPSFLGSDAPKFTPVAKSRSTACPPPTLDEYVPNTST